MSDEITMKDVVFQLGIDCDTSKGQTYIVCPICAKNERQKKLNINFKKNVFRCNKCDISGGPIAFWGLYKGLSDPKEIAKDYFKTVKGSGKEKALPEKKAPEEEYVEEYVAPVEKRDLAYRALLTETTLSQKHREDLRKRGLSDDAITRNEYRSVPMYNLRKLAQKIQKEHGVILEGIPGFYTNDGAWELRKFKSGILIPQKNGKGQIQGFQIRFDEAREDSPRYISLSSRDMDNGSPAHAYCHLRPGKKGARTVILTEGALKADVISYYTGYSVLALPGVNSRKYLPAAIRDLKRFGLKKIVIAFDMDKKWNEHVLKALDGLKSELSEMDVDHSTLNWDENYKGFDDYLYNKYSSKKTQDVTK